MARKPTGRPPGRPRKDAPPPPAATGYRVMEHDEIIRRLRTSRYQVPGWPRLGLTEALRDEGRLRLREVCAALGMPHLIAPPTYSTKPGAKQSDPELREAVIGYAEDDSSWWLIDPYFHAPPPLKLVAVPMTAEGIGHFTSPDHPKKKQRAAQAEKATKGNIWGALDHEEQVLLVYLAGAPPEDHQAIIRIANDLAKIRRRLDPMGAMPAEVENLIDPSKAPDPAVLAEIRERKRERAQVEEEIRQKRNQRYEWAAREVMRDMISDHHIGKRDSVPAAYDTRDMLDMLRGKERHKGGPLSPQEAYAAVWDWLDGGAA